MQPVPNSIAAMAPDLAAWRRDLHRHPELRFEEHRTAGIVADKLRDWGFDAVETGIGGTGVVGVLHGQTGPQGEAILLRADMDALPIHEETALEHASVEVGKMHACGHDGHTTMLLGAARHLAETRNFSGTVYFCFQPAEEGGAGARAMIDDGLFERYPARAVYGLHNWPGMPAGRFGLRPGGLMASCDDFTITVRGAGGHGAMPHLTRDPVLAGAQIVSAVQSIVSRRVDPNEAAVVSVTTFHAGSTTNVIAREALLSGTTRAFSDEVITLIRAEMERICAQVAAAFDLEVSIGFADKPFPATVNDAAEAAFVGDVIESLVGSDDVDRDVQPTMGGEDFAFMAERKPGCFFFIGNGESAPLHAPTYDFNDDISPLGVALWTRLVEAALPAR